jgi:hypothetical protein
MVDIDTIAGITRIIIGIILVGIIIYGLIRDRKKKKLNVASRGRGTVDENGNITDYTLDGFDIIK